MITGAAITLPQEGPLLKSGTRSFDPLRPLPFAIPQTAIASLLPVDLSLVQRQVSESSGHSARLSTDRRSAIAAIGGGTVRRLVLTGLLTWQLLTLLERQQLSHLI